MKIILGIDPGSRITGYGIIQTDGLRHRYIACGSIKTVEKDFIQRLQQIYAGIRAVVEQYQPESAAIEQVFMHQNAGAALKLGQARGAAIVATAMPMAEYSARQVKQAVVGYGAAQKLQVQQMVKILLNLNLQPETDAADALAIAICHANSSFSAGRMGKSSLRIRRGRVR